MSGSVVNIAGYRFADMPDRDDLRQPLRDLCQDLDLKGTILLAHEGINSSCWQSNSIDSFVELARGRSSIHQYTTQDFIRLSAISPDECPLEEGEILDHIKPAEMTGEEITPKRLNSFSITEMKIILDTRNEYECRIGTFENALN